MCEVDRSPSPLAHLIVGFLYSDPTIYEAALAAWSQASSSPQRLSPQFPFTESGYYAPEMGESLYRRFVSFTQPISLETLPSWKHLADTLEAQWSIDGKRQINIDPGYLDFHKVVLLSSKFAAQKIYISEAVWADMVLMKKKGGYQTFPWTFPDLKSSKYHEFFLEARNDFKQAMRHLSPSPKL